MTFLREPLLHFVLLGAAMFVIYGLVSEERGGKPGHIVVTQGTVDNLAATFARVWQRPPAAQELAGLIQDYVREEVLYREALALGLDRDDTIIRRRLRQKMEFVSEDVAAQAEPSEDDLRAYLQAHPEAFAVEPCFTFRQVYLDPLRRGAHLARDIDRLRAELRHRDNTADLAELGDSVLLAHQFDNVSATEVRTIFGDTFVAGLSALTPGQWQGPVPSGYGVHLVYVSDHTAGRIPELAEVREAVRRAWAHAQRLDASETFYQTLLRRYTVTIERPQAAQATENTQRTRRSP
jgi:PPIC-type PPIASE domain